MRAPTGAPCGTSEPIEIVMHVVNIATETGTVRTLAESSDTSETLTVPASVGLSIVEEGTPEVPIGTLEVLLNLLRLLTATRMK